MIYVFHDIPNSILDEPYEYWDSQSRHGRGFIYSCNICRKVCPFARI
jgi:hypothetical protein